MSENLSTSELIRCLIRLRSRAERLEPDQVVDSFSTVGPLLDLISTEDHQLVFGRRGTGKTHALRYLYATRNDAGECAIFVDMRNLGSDGSIYNDPNLPITDRATRLLIDTLAFIQDGILDHAFTLSDADLKKLNSPVDRLGDAISKVRVRGDVIVTEEETKNNAETSKTGILAKFATKGSEVNIDASNSKTAQNSANYLRQSTGVEELSVRFPELSSSLRDVVNVLPAKRVWIILDEWSSIPLILQPFLADMLRRAFFTIPKITVKIGAIEHRAKFVHELGIDESIGFEVTADVRGNVRLDDYLLFDNSKEDSIDFFKEFLFRHVKSYCKENNFTEPKTAEEVYRKAFNQKNSFEEFVKAAEGVPRDALHIASICAQKANGGTIDIPNVRAAGHRYYQEDKSSQVDSNPALRDMLQFVVDNAIRQKKTNAFLLEVGKKDIYVDALFDRRLIHIRQRNVSSRDNPGARYFHYKIDYGCYVDLIATKQMPAEQSFVGLNSIEDIAKEVEVPTDDDARSYRRSILSLDGFYSLHPEHEPTNE